MLARARPGINADGNAAMFDPRINRARALFDARRKRARSCLTREESARDSANAARGHALLRMIPGGTVRGGRSSARTFEPSPFFARSRKKRTKGSVQNDPRQHYKSDRIGFQERRVAHKVHRLWDRRSNPACGLLDDAAAGQLFAVGHGRALQALRVLSMALRISSSLRITATSATLAGLPAVRRRK